MRLTENGLVFETPEEETLVDLFCKTIIQTIRKASGRVPQEPEDIVVYSVRFAEIMTGDKQVVRDPVIEISAEYLRPEKKTPEGVPVH